MQGYLPMKTSYDKAQVDLAARASVVLSLLSHWAKIQGSQARTGRPQKCQR